MSTILRILSIVAGIAGLGAATWYFWGAITSIVPPTIFIGVGTIIGVVIVTGFFWARLTRMWGNLSTKLKGLFTRRSTASPATPAAPTVTPPTPSPYAPDTNVFLVFISLLPRFKYIVAISAASAILAMVDLDVFYLILGVITPCIVAYYGFFLCAPVWSQYLVNQPGLTRPSGFHLFTERTEGRAKFFVRGKVVVRGDLLMAGHCYAREGDPSVPRHLWHKAPAFWDIRPCRDYDKPVLDVDGKETGQTIRMPNMPEEDPIQDINPYLQVWARWVLVRTGVLFSGFYPWQRVREQKFERVEFGPDPSAPPEVQAAQAKLSYPTHTVIDQSDHFRTLDSQFLVEADAADTLDRVSVRALAILNCKVINPYRAAFATDRWDRQISYLALNAATNYTRAHMLDDVLSAKTAANQNTNGTPTAVDGFQKAIEAIKDDSPDGFEIQKVAMLEITPNLSEAELKELYAGALAKPLAEARRIKGLADVDVLKATNKAMSEVDPQIAIAAQESEAMVRAAAATKDGAIVMLGAGSSKKQSISPLDAAILAELKRGNRR